jgi:hypothetical protein
MGAAHWSSGASEASLIAEPVYFKAEFFRQRDEPESEPNTCGTFWLTPNRLIAPSQSISHSYTGEVNVETAWKVNFTLENGLPLTFTNRYRYRKNEDEETITYSELVAEYELQGKAQTFEAVYTSLGDLEDLLRIASLAARHSCVCRGFSISNTEGYRVDFYRGDMSVPSSKNREYDELIDIANIEEFLRTAYHKFIELGRNNLIRQAINYTVPSRERTVESSFITLYSALETLVLYFRRQANLETVFSQDEQDQWGQIQAELKRCLKTHSLLQGDRGKEKRKLLYENMPALERVAFSTALQACYTAYNVDISDLWHITSNKEGWSLSVIRNKLVHGEHFNRPQRRAIAAAKVHLQWAVERLLLAILGWDISKSFVDQGFLSRNIIIYKDWKTDQRILSI